jgi:O-antigen/teichoic acid export membrane protein
MTEYRNISTLSGTEEMEVLHRGLPEHLTASSQDPARQDLKKKLIRDSFNYFLSKAIPGIMTLCSVLAFVRLVGNAEYGRYSVLFALVTACTAGLSGWLPQGILRYFSMSHTGPEATRFKSATLLGLVLSIVTGTFVLGIALWFERQPFWRGILGVLLLATGMLYGVFVMELQAMLKSQKVASFEAIRSISCFVVPICIIFLAGKRSAGALLTGVLVGYILPLLVAWWKEQDRANFLRMALNNHSWNDDLRVLRTIWTYGWPVGIWSMCLTLQSAIDRYFIQHYSGDASAGSYAAMYDIIVRSFSLLCFPLVMSANSLVMERWNKGDRRSAVSLVGSSLKYQIVISVLLFLGLVLLAQQVSHVILGDRHESSSSLVLPLAVGGFLWQISYLVHKPLELMCLTKRMLTAMIVALIVNVAGNYLFIPVYGYTAAAYVAIAAPLAYLVAAVVLTPMAEFRREISVRAVPLVVGESSPRD